jgi:hypothetical protein
VESSCFSLWSQLAPAGTAPWLSGGERGPLPLLLVTQTRGTARALELDANLFVVLAWYQIDTNGKENPTKPYPTTDSQNWE